MSLSYDTARCAGTTAPLCATCARREPGRDEWQSHIAAAWTPAGCGNYIDGAPVLTVRADTQEDVS